MNVYEVDPLQDSRWLDLLHRHPRASVFHTPAWLRALKQSYGYEPVVLTTSAPAARLENGFAFCRIDSWLTGRRLVSLPFSDHCEPLFDSLEDFNCLIQYLQQSVRRSEWKYLEFRPINGKFARKTQDAAFQSCGTYLLHRLDLRPSGEELFRALDKSSVQRRIRRAERAGLIEKSGRSETLLREFYRLMVRTRRRHRLPPQPYEWFRNLVDCLGEAMELRLAYKGDVPIAAILIMRFKGIFYYKYGCSDLRFHNLGAVPFLIWNAILNAKSSEGQEFDFGRSAEGHNGLVRFKNHWVSAPAPLLYWRYPAPLLAGSAERWTMRLLKCACAWAPNALLAAAGRRVYRHIG